MESVGICEHCGALLTMEGMPAEAIDIKWTCSVCNGTLTHKSWGCKKINGEWKKVKWPDENGKWTTNITERAILLSY